MNLLKLTFTDEQIAAHNVYIRDQLLRRSPYLKTGNFELIAPSDLELTFDLYDALIFDDWFRATLPGKTSSPLTFRLSRKMTRAGGKTTRTRFRNGTLPFYDIAISTELLFSNFCGESRRRIYASGVLCHDRLDALLRIMEHEMLHLAEMLEWDESSCSAPRFQQLAKRIFAHTSHQHQLVVSTEAAAAAGIRVGTPVEFYYQGIHHAGIVNRINKRATVLVESPVGTRYTDGRRYLKYYVPVAHLRAAKQSQL